MDDTTHELGTLCAWARLSLNPDDLPVTIADAVDQVRARIDLSLISGLLDEAATSTAAHVLAAEHAEWRTNPAAAAAIIYAGVVAVAGPWLATALDEALLRGHGVGQCRPEANDTCDCYDLAGQQRWILAIAAIEGAALRAAELEYGR